MLAVLITLTSGCQNEYIVCQKAKVRIAVLPIMDERTGCNSTVELFVSGFRLQEFTRVWFENPNYSDYRPLFTIQDERTIVKYVMEVLGPFRYWTLWMSNRHTVTLHHVITVYNDMLDHTDGVMRVLAKKKTQWKEELFFAVKLAWQMLFKYYAEVTPTMGMLVISAHILNPFRKLWSFRKLDKGLDIYPENKTSYTTQYQVAFLKYVENKFCDKHRRVPVNKLESLPSTKPILSAMASESCQSSFDPDDLSSNDDEYLTTNDVAGTLPGRGKCAARLFTATRLYLNSAPQAPKNWEQINPNLNDYHSNPMEIRSTLRIPDITDWWHQPKETHWKHADLCNVVCDIFSIIPYGVRVEASFSVGRDVIGWRQLKSTCGTLRKKSLSGSLLEPTTRFRQALTQSWIQWHRQNVNQSGSHPQTSQTLQLTSPVLPSTSRCFQAALELRKELSDAARAFSGAPESSSSYWGAFRILRDMTCSIVKFWSSGDLWAGLWEKSRAAETTAQLCRRLGAVMSQQWFLAFHKHKAFHLSYSSLLQSHDSLPHNIACII